MCKGLLEKAYVDQLSYKGTKLLWFAYSKGMSGRSFCVLRESES